MTCTKKMTLLTAYAASVRRFSVALSRLNRQIGAMSKGDFDLLYKKTEDLLQDIAAIRMKLDTHIRTHGC